jgi:hypothetical protein
MPEEVATEAVKQLAQTQQGIMFLGAAMVVLASLAGVAYILQATGRWKPKNGSHEVTEEIRSLKSVVSDGFDANSDDLKTLADSQTTLTTSIALLLDRTK